MGTRAREVSRLLTRIYDEHLRPTGLQGSQLPVLVAAALFGAAGAPMGTLADKLVMERTTLTRTLKPLEAAGYVRIARQPGDARARIVLLTRAGAQVLESAYPRWEAAQRRVRRALGGAQFEELHARLSGVVAASFDAASFDATPRRSRSGSRRSSSAS